MRSLCLHILILLCVCISAADAQDIHFSQFQASPLTLNPALTGAFNGSYRLAANGRSQWRSVTVPYQTFGFSAERRGLSGMKNASAGLNMFYDQAGDSRLNTTHVNFAAAYAIPINKDQKLHIGAQPGISQRKISYDDLTFDNDYFGRETGESFASSQLFHMNLNTGIMWAYAPEKSNTHFNAGLAFFNLTRPRQSFFGNEEIRLDRRVSVHAGLSQRINQRTWIQPAFIYSRQGTYQEFVTGGNLRYVLIEKRNEVRALYAGIWTRVGDAAIFSIGMDYDNLFIGLSYDLNYSRLVPASNHRGGFELALIYIIPEIIKRKHYRICPVHL
ncbi:MAG: PorP/SprF family type IX secretion system membrane protein [Cytophagaceae bacterium]